MCRLPLWMKLTDGEGTAEASAEYGASMGRCRRCHIQIRPVTVEVNGSPVVGVRCSRHGVTVVPMESTNARPL